MRKTGVGKVTVKDKKRDRGRDRKTMRQIYNGIDSGGGDMEGLEGEVRRERNRAVVKRLQRLLVLGLSE